MTGLMHRGALWSALIAAAAVSSPARADADAQFWLTTASDVRIDDATALTFDAIIRSRPDRVEAGQMILRAGVRRALGRGWSVQITYGWVDTLVEDGDDRVEHRFGETLGRSLGTIGTARLDARIGLEQRLASGGGELGWRVRPRLRLVQPLGAAIDAQISDEVIVALNQTAWGQRDGISGNRLATALRFRVSPRLGIAPGYTWQHIVLPRADRDDHIIGITLDAHF